MRRARRPRAVAWVLAFLVAAALLDCGAPPGQRPEDVLEVVERAAAAWDAEDFDAMVACYTGRHAGRFREELATVHDGDPARFFASKRRMAAVGPVNVRRRAFATVRIFVVRPSGYKPYAQISVVFNEGEWRLATFLPGDIEQPPVDRANPLGIIGLLRDAADITSTGSEGVFGQIQTIRAIEVVSVRRLAAAVEPLMLLVASEHEAAVRQFAAYTLGRLGDPAAIPVLVGVLEDDDLRVRADAATSLAALGATDALPGIEWLAREDPVPWVRQQAASAVEILQTGR